jgi:hypothetical protein
MKETNILFEQKQNFFNVTVTYGLKSLRETRKKSVIESKGPKQYLRTK